MLVRRPRAGCVAAPVRGVHALALPARRGHAERRPSAACQRARADAALRQLLAFKAQRSQILLSYNVRV